MNVHNMMSHGDTPLCQIQDAYVKEQRWSNSWLKNNFDIEVKGQSHTEVMNVCDTLSHGDTLICQIWYANDIKAKQEADGPNCSPEKTQEKKI